MVKSCVRDASRVRLCPRGGFVPATDSECCECGAPVEFEKSDYCEICGKPMCDVCRDNNGFDGLCQACFIIKNGETHDRTASSTNR